jgi:hypothetical protein
VEILYRGEFVSSCNLCEDEKFEKFTVNDNDIAMAPEEMKIKKK